MEDTKETKQKFFTENKNHDQLIALYNQFNAFAKDNGMSLVVDEIGHAVSEMKIVEKHQSAPGHCHGGVIAGLMDATLGASALSYAFANGKLCATVEFKINYFLPVKLHDEIVAEANLEHTGKRLVHTVCDIKNKKTGKIVAKGIGTFNLYPMNKQTFE
ncbi:PaaI family thioesterase [Bernardetia sp.]|uniref:PaaI family thioesterase n=1 Tax=Bernardetia sp. TaxID=1937974 RepID=UPI0025C0A0B7|nr:PaaI family thioesterase [Bernardetia sp.]